MEGALATPSLAVVQQDGKLGRSAGGVSCCSRVALPGGWSATQMCRLRSLAGILGPLPAPAQHFCCASWDMHKRPHQTLTPVSGSSTAVMNHKCRLRRTGRSIKQA
ncbi:hypothetical protein ABPG77_001013 [Micractinium sp. CCAP 211/92]